MKERDDEVADLCQRVEELSVAGKAATEEISRLWENFGSQSDGSFKSGEAGAT